MLFDTEFTAWEGSRERGWSEPWEHREVIQLAAIKLQVENRTIQVLESFNELVKPTINPTLSEYIVQLTGIKQSILDEMAVDFASALNQFHSFCSDIDISALCWGIDFKILHENCVLYGLEWQEFPTGLKDLKTLLKSKNVDFGNVNSGQLADYLGIDLPGHKHNALHDVRCIAAALELWINSGQLELSDLQGFYS